jgi:hypothetical protein
MEDENETRRFPAPLRNWDKTVRFDLLPPHPWARDFPGYAASDRAEWVRQHAEHPLAGGFVEAVDALMDGPRSHLSLTPEDEAISGTTEFRPYTVRTYRLDGDHPRFWCRLPFTVSVQKASGAGWLEVRGEGELVATDPEGYPIRYSGLCVPWTLVQGISEMLDRWVFHAAIRLEEQPTHGVFAPPPYPECPVLTL